MAFVPDIYHILYFFPRREISFEVSTFGGSLLSRVRFFHNFTVISWFAYLNFTEKSISWDPFRTSKLPEQQFVASF